MILTYKFAPKAAIPPVIPPMAALPPNPIPAAPALCANANALPAASEPMDAASEPAATPPAVNTA